MAIAPTSLSWRLTLLLRIGKLNPNHRPDFTNTEPPFDIPPNPSWSTPGKIVALDPWGHLSPQLFRREFEEGKDIRPTIGARRGGATCAAAHH